MEPALPHPAPPGRVPGAHVGPRWLVLPGNSMWRAQTQAKAPCGGPQAWPDHPTPAVQVDGGSQSLPRLQWGVPALTHSPCEVAALGGVPGEGGTVSSASCSILPSCLHPPLHFLFSTLGVQPCLGSLGPPYLALCFENLWEGKGTSGPGRQTQGLLPTLCQDPRGWGWGGVETPPVLWDQHRAGGTLSVTTGTQGPKEPGRPGAPPTRRNPNFAV